MPTVDSLHWGRILARGLAAGICGGVLFALFIYVATLRPEHASLANWFQFVASSAFGKIAYTAPSYVWIGLLMHAAASIAWGIGYAYLSDVQAAVNQQPVVSGIIFGLIVYVVMQIALASVGMLVLKHVSQLGYGVLGHTVFFGLPVALINDWLRPRRS